jgi:phage terminase large subunit
MAAIDAHKSFGIEPSGRNQVGFDVADSGTDKNALVHAYGPSRHVADQWKAGEDELLKSATRARAAAAERNAQLVYDSIGVGAGVGAKVNELNTPARRLRTLASMPAERSSARTSCMPGLTRPRPTGTCSPTPRRSSGG